MSNVKMSKITYVIFHGAYGDVNGNWFPYIKQNLLSLGQEVILEQYPVENWDEVEKTGKTFIPTKQTLPNWLIMFKRKVLPRLQQKNLCFIGHSLGPVFILYLVEKFNIKLDCAIFVMPFLQALRNKNAWQFDVVNESFYKTNFDYKKLQKKIPLSYTLYSDNDPYVKSELALSFAKKLNSSPILIKNALHINAPLFTKNPLVLELCKTLLEPTEYLK